MENLVFGLLGLICFTNIIRPLLYVSAFFVALRSQSYRGTHLEKTRFYVALILLLGFTKIISVPFGLSKKDGTKSAENPRF